MQIRKAVIAAAAFGALTAMCSAWTSASAAIYTPDTKIGQARLGNSGDQSELDALAAAAGVSASSLTLDTKVSSPTVLTDDSGHLYFDVAPDEPGYFLVKVGNLGSGSGVLDPPPACTGGTCDTFFFRNIAELTKLVFFASDIGLTNISPNIGKISHYTTANVPLPAALPLLATGLMACGTPVVVGAD